MSASAIRLLVSTLLLCSTLPAQSDAAKSAANWRRIDGYVPLYWDSSRGRLLMQVPQPGQDILFFGGAAQGIGSVALGLDWGARYFSDVIYFQRVGPRVQVIQRNLKFRALTGNEALHRELSDSFAESILASLPIESEEGGRTIVDATSFFIRDSANIEGYLRRANQGTYKLDVMRSAIYLPRTKGFERNTEVEATLTYASEMAGPLLGAVAPDGRSVTMRVHYSFLRPPDDGYKPRRADIRIGALGPSFKDYSRPYQAETDTHWVERFRLEKKDPSAPLSEPKEPLVYYLDAAIPEPVRSAMRDGILWWNRAFEAAGFKNAIVVRDPTPDMDPLDVRYSFVFWVNRDERGFSVGDNYSDPRTGQILAARARMDSARIRTISNYWKAYRASGIAPGMTEEQFVLLREALVTAHEVGHTLGFPHTWNSSMNDRASVMEYPSPRIRLTADNKIDLSDAYQREVGELDKFMIRYSYSELPATKENEALNAIVSAMRNRKLIFTPETDPRWARYDDLSDAANYLREAVKQRQVLLSHYGLDSLDPGEEVAHLRGEGLWMTYLHHRWAIDAGTRYIGGMYHNYVLKGDALAPTEIVPAAYQREILGLLAAELQPKELAFPEPLLRLLTVDPATDGSAESGFRSTTEPEEFHMETGYAFDYLSAARTLADIIIGQILKPEAANRLISFAGRQENALTLPETIDVLSQATWNAPRENTPMKQAIRRVTPQVLVDELMMLAANTKSSPETRAVVINYLTGLKGKLAGMRDDDPVTEAMLRETERQLAQFLVDPAARAPRSAALPQPAGAPI